MGMGGAAALAVFGAKVMTQAARPNVLLVFDDDHPPYMMQPMPVVRKGIRDRGVNSRGGHADIPLCGPNRVSLLTGLSVTTHLCDTNPTYALLLERNPGLEDLILPAFSAKPAIGPPTRESTSTAGSSPNRSPATGTAGGRRSSPGWGTMGPRSTPTARSSK